MKSPPQREGLEDGAGIHADRQLRWMQPVLLKTLCLTPMAAWVAIVPISAYASVTSRNFVDAAHAGVARAHCVLNY